MEFRPLFLESKSLVKIGQINKIGMSQDIKELLREVLTDELTGLRIELSDFRKEVTVRFEEVNGQFEKVVTRPK